MSRNDLKSLRKLMGALHQPEQASLEVLLSAFHSKFGEYNPKTLQLFKLLNEKEIEVGSDEKLKLIICSQQSNDTYYKLMSRLKEKVFENLIMDINIKRKGAYSGPWVKQQTIRKNLVVADVLAMRGLVQEALALIDRSIKEAEKYELYIEICQFLNSKFNLLLRQNKHKDALRVEKDWIRYSAFSEIYSKSQYYFYATAFGAKKSNKRQYEEELASKINDLESYSLIKEVPIAYYYLLFMKIQLAEIRDNHEVIMALGYECLDLLFANPKIAKRARYANSYMQIYTANIYLHRYDEAYENISKVLDYVNQDSKNYLQTQEGVFYSRFYAGKYEDSEIILKSLEQHMRKILRKEDPYIQKINLHRAYQAFVNGNYHAAGLILLESREPGKEEVEHNINLRMLQIMVRLSLNDFDSADAMIENLRKYVESLKKLNKIRRRYVFIQKILNKLSSSGFDFDGTFTSEKKLFLQLASGQDDCSWNYFSPEIYPFHAWFQQQTRQKVLINEETGMPQEGT